MKKVYWLALVLGFALSCTEETPLTNRVDDQVAMPTQRACASYEVLQAQIAQDPERGRRLDEIESFIQKVQDNPKMGRLVNGVYEIPVYVNVIFNKAAENISDAQIQSQIDVLNEDFNATNPDFSLVPTLFQNVSANVGIRFVWNSKDITRKSSTKKSWGTNDAMKKATQGGINPTNPTTYLNMWACVLSNGILGYAQFPGGASATDGVVIHTQAFGSRAKVPTGYFMATYDLGRTATHEVGHWMNLRHIWGDATCGSDLVNDTPTHNTANYGCPAAGHLSTCSGTPVEMWMNYMDYTDDKCMYMFTAGQKERINAAFASGGGRNSFAQP